MKKKIIKATMTIVALADWVAFQMT